jgi:hypothetical protein
MRERKQYPDLSDEELDRRAEETLKRMLNAPPKPQGQPQHNPGGPGNNSNRQRRKKQRHR